MRFFLLDHFSRHPWGCVEALKPFLGPFFPRKLLINMLVTLIGENSASESQPSFFKTSHMYSQTPQYRRSWNWRKSGGIPKTAVLGVIYNLQNPYCIVLGRGGGIGRGGIGGGGGGDD